MEIVSIINTVGIALGLAAIYGGLHLGQSWLRHYQTTTDEKRMGQIIDVLVTAAEQMDQRMGSGEKKLDWVLTQLKKRVSEFDEDLARVLIEAAVHRMNQQTTSTPGDVLSPVVPTARHRQWKSE